MKNINHLFVKQASLPATLVWLSVRSRARRKKGSASSSASVNRTENYSSTITREECQEFHTRNYSIQVHTSVTSKANGIPKWLHIFLWKPVASTSSTSTKLLRRLMRQPMR